MCLGYIDGDPSIPKGAPGYSPMHSKYYEWPRERAAIDQALVGDAVNRRLAQQHDLTEQAIRRYKAEHLPDALVQAGAAQEVARADVLIQQVEGLRNKAVGILLKAEKAAELRTALMAIREAREILALLLEVEGRLDRRPVNILVAPNGWICARCSFRRLRPTQRRAVRWWRR